MDIFCQETGDINLPAILFLHGAPLSGRMWQPQVERLNEYHCLVPDLPGHANSASIPFTLEKTISDLAKLIRNKTQTGKAHVIGLSFGGVVAQALMVAYPDLVDHVILSGTATRMSSWMIQIQRLNEPIMRMMTPIQLANLVSKQFGIPLQYQSAIASDFKDFSIKSFSEVMRCYGDIEMPATTKSPTLICIGEKETGIAKSMARQLENGIPNSRRIVIPEGSHVWNMQYPDLFCSITRTWIESESLPEEVVFG